MVYNKTEIARKSGIARQTVFNILTGREKNPKLETLQKMAKSMDCSVDTLLDQIKNETSSTTAKKSNSSQSNKVT